MGAKVLTAVIFYFVYWGICFLGTGTDAKNLIGLRSYPDAVQQAVRQNPQLGAKVPAAQPMWQILASNIGLFSVVFAVLGLALKPVLGLDSFAAAFWYLLALGEGLGLFDLVVIDLLWWRNTRRTRFSFLPDKAMYQDPGKHIGSFVRGIPMFAVVAALSAAVVSLL